MKHAASQNERLVQMDTKPGADHCAIQHECDNGLSLAKKTCSQRYSILHALLLHTLPMNELEEGDRSIGVDGGSRLEPCCHF